jgi:hypothetical protein
MWRKLWFNDGIDNRIKQLIQSGAVFINHDTGLIEPRMKASEYDCNWLFCGNTTSLRDCYLWHQIMFRVFDIVPEFCRKRCYKVVVKVRNFMEAMQFYGLMNSSGCINAELTPIHGKVGMDERHYSDGAFNGFVYCDGPDNGLEKYSLIRKLVNDHMEDGENINIILKRSCTEFEKSYGPTDNEFWNTEQPGHLDIERHLMDIFAPCWRCSTQPDWLKNKIVLRLAKWANSHGDKSWVDYFGQDFLTMKAVTYHLPVCRDDKENEDGTSQD